MLTGRTLRSFRRQVLEWFRKYQRDLPWRRTRDPYQIWLSEIMLQQTRVATVIPYFERFLKKFPSVRALAEAPEEDVLRMWSGLGYYSRARNLQKAAKEIVAKHRGEFPRTQEDTLALPGIGRYTASAILSIAYGVELAVLDGNVARVLARLEAVRGDLCESRRWKSLQENADKLLDRESPGDWNQALMELGATLCVPRAPQCLLCPVSKHCRARQLGLTTSLPEKRRKRETEEIQIAAGIFLDSQERTLLLPPPRTMPGNKSATEIAPLVSRLWHFPAVQARKNPAAELHEHLVTLLSKAFCKSMMFEPLSPARHTVTYRSITLLPFRIRLAELPILAGAKIVPLVGICSPASHAVSNLTRKLARAALPAEEAMAAAN